LNKQFETNTAEQTELKTNADLMEKRLDAASRLIAGLGSEHERWSRELQELAIARVKLLGDCLVASSFLRFIIEHSLTSLTKLNLDPYLF
jgi:dynein heavy chain